MNWENLHKIIERYENDLDVVYGEHQELFKWRAAKAWQDAFHSASSTESFKTKFSSAKKQFYFLIDNGFEHPSTGIIKLWEKEPETIEHLVFDVLLSNTDGDRTKVESNMQTFLDEYEALRSKYYPEALSYKITPHAASVLMTLDQPDVHYIFRIHAAKRMADYIGFDEDLGSGKKPNIANYYKLCDAIVSALREHESLVQKHFSYLNDQMYKDESLHLMVFDLMHCSGYRGYYTGLIATKIRPAQKRKSYTGPSAEELARIEQRRLEMIADLEKRIDELELSIEDFEEISLIGVEVSFPKYGKGTVVEQDANKITVQFPEIKKGFVLDKEYTMRPRFENDEAVVEAFTTYGHTLAEIDSLKKQLDKLSKE